MLGNRTIFDGHRVDGLQTIGSRQRHHDLMTVFILPETGMIEERTVLLMAILNQIEMLFMLYRFDLAGHDFTLVPVVDRDK
jgi:hypothetical protein